MINAFLLYEDMILDPMYYEIVSAREFVDLYKTRAADMLSTKIIPPKLGADHFGYILIEWKRPINQHDLLSESELFT